MNNFTIKDLNELKRMLKYATRYLNDLYSDMDVITKMNGVCTNFWERGYKDLRLHSFKGIWSEVTDMQDEIEGKYVICIRPLISDEVATQEELDNYIALHRPKMKEWCKEIIEEYGPIVGELKRQCMQEQNTK